MAGAVVPAVLLALVFAGRRAARPIGEYFRVTFAAGHISATRGEVPHELLQDITRLVRAEPTASGTVRVVVGEPHPEIEIVGLSAGAAQVLRNAFHTSPLRQRRGAPPSAPLLPQRSDNGRTRRRVKRRTRPDHLKVVPRQESDDQ